MWLRTIKSAEEIVLIKEGARTADIGGEAIRDAIREAGYTPRQRNVFYQYIDPVPA